MLFTVYLSPGHASPRRFGRAERLSRPVGHQHHAADDQQQLCIAASVVTMRGGRLRPSLHWLIAGIVLALGYPVIKLIEIRWNLAHGSMPRQGVRRGHYYLTLNHLVHASWGSSECCGCFCTPRNRGLFGG